MDSSNCFLETSHTPIAPIQVSTKELSPKGIACTWIHAGRDRLIRGLIADVALVMIGILAFAGVFFFSTMALAHTPLMACFDNGDGTVTCNGGFSDGSSASGVTVRVINGQEKTLIEGTMDQDSEFTFDKPEGRFTVVFDAGPGHVVKEKSDSIE